MSTVAVKIENIRYCYGDRVALDDITLSIAAQQVFAILGPNGSGKSTLFKLLSTLVPLQEGDVFIDGHSVRTSPDAARQKIGVVFQYPSLDRKLTVYENISCQAALVGLRGSQRASRIDEVMQLLKLADRKNERAEKLSGGLKRRVELAKGILHRPSILLLDEPSTGLDPSARLDYWTALQELKTQFGTTIAMTTHLLEEADKADRICIFHRGKIVAEDSPENLRREMGDAILTLQSREPQATHEQLLSRFGWQSEIVGNQVRVRESGAASKISEINNALGDSIDSLTLGRPSLEDVFVAKTGESFEDVQTAK